MNVDGGPLGIGSILKDMNGMVLAMVGLSQTNALSLIIELDATILWIWMDIKLAGLFSCI